MRYYVKARQSYLVERYKDSDPARTLIKEYAHLFTYKEAQKALTYCESIPQRVGLFYIEEVN